MKISIQDDINTTLYLSKEYTDTIDFSNKLNIENYFRCLFKKLKTFYDFDIKGFYNIKIYSDKYYGSILKLQKEDIEYYDYFDNHIDMRFSIKDYNSFLYEINDLFDIDESLEDKILLYIYHNRLCVRIIKEIESIKLGKLIENSKIIYDEEINDIIDYGKIVKL